MWMAIGKLLALIIMGSPAGESPVLAFCMPRSAGTRQKLSSRVSHE
jgi:hypothetical protein